MASGLPATVDSPAEESDARFAQAQLQALAPAVTRDGDLDAGQAERFTALIERVGWPASWMVGPELVQVAAQLLLKHPDYEFQRSTLDLAEDRIDLDVDAFALARLSDLVKQKHDGGQRFGTLKAIVDDKVIASPEIKGMSGARFFRDFQGLPSVEEEVAALQRRLDAGEALHLDNGLLWLPKPAVVFGRPQLREKLGEMIARDQGARSKLLKSSGAERDKVIKEIRSVDQQNHAQLQRIFDEIGFPDVAAVGRAGVSTVFLLVQHADDDPALQKRALVLAKPLVDSRQMARQQYALLTDRVLRGEGKPQRYGTQTSLVGGKVQLQEAEDPSHLDERRAQMALGPVSEYIELLQERVSAASGS
ncbi:MAG TPA: DUF6624 domain-containing protein [Stenotrophomonas sp.]|nr:DUF6624 domain-containing protein [Stenotrophomonas sp.]